MFKKIMIPMIAVIAAVILAYSTNVFSKPANQASKNKKIATDYWVYVPNTTGFADTAKYIKVTLDDPEDESCPSGSSFPCVYKAATGSLSTKAGLYNDLQMEGSDANILAASQIIFR